MKRKISKIIISFLLTMAMVVGLMSGISLTAYAAPTEELLTTITSTGKEQASYSTANVATVSFSYTAGGSSAYLANWGWWGYGWTATVNAAEGYTITKCVFYDDANRTATDSSSPFVVETTEEDKTPRINGTPIDGGKYQSKGIKKIEVYGYATPASSYSVTITAGDHMTKTAGSGDAEQTGLTGAMTDVVYTADDGYYFPEDYSVEEVNGITVTRNSYTQITVSGTPTADAAIALTAPTAKTTPDAPTTAAATDCTTADNNDGTLTGVTTEMEYKKSDAADWTAGTGSDITGLVPGTYYVRVKATDTTNESANQELTIKGFISYTVTFKVVNGKWNEGEGDAATADKTVTLTGRDGDTLKLTANQIPGVGSKPNDTYKAGSWDTTPSADTEITGTTTYTYTYAQKDSISQTVTFKVVNGSWNDETTTDKTVTLTGYEGDTLKLAANQIPTVGTKPNDTYKAGSWDVTPSADTEITGATTYTYTYAQKDSISQTVTFKVVNGSWNDETTTDKTVTLTGYEGDTLKLTADQIPAVGSKPNDTYKAGSWDTTPSADTEITGTTTYTYTYAQKDSISQTVTFKVVNGSWNDETTTDKTVTLTGYEGDTLKLAANQIPTVGTKPNDTYKAGSWDVTPSADTEITGATTYTYTYAQKDSISQTVTFKVVNGSWNDETTTDKTVTLTGYEGDTLKLTADQIPTVGTKPADTYKAGSWDVTPDTSTAITSDTTFTYTYAEKETVTHTVTFKVQKGSWDDGTTEDKTATVSDYEDEVLKLAADQIPEVGKKPDENCKAGAWDVVPDTEKEITDDITCTYSYVDKDAVTATVTFKVVDGSWNDGTTLDKTVTFSGYEGDVFTLAADQIPEAGANPADTFKAGSWDKVPEADTEITGNVTYTYSYAKKDTISYTATFKVVNGTWNDGTSDDVVLTLSGYEGDTLKFTSDQIPAAGTKPSKNYKAGSWDASFSSENELTKDTTYTYTYKEKDKISQTVTFKVVNGAWDDGTTADKIVTLNGYEGDTLALKSSDIPSVGTKPADSYKAGKWDIVPSSETDITEKVTYTYTYEKKEDGEEDNKITYSNTAGAGSVWTLGSTGTLTFTFSRNENDSETIKHFAGAKVDGKELESNDYSFKPGSVVIDLKADYLNKLSVGKHTLTAMFDDGDDVTVEFTIKEKASEGEKKSDTTPDNKKADVTPGNKKTAKTDAPGTGDTVNIQLIFLVMVLSMCDIFALFNLRSKLDEKKRRR